LTCQVLSELKISGYKVIDRPHQGVAAARNTGIRLAQGEYILPLDPDNYILPAYIYRGVEILDRFSDVAVVYSDVERFGRNTATSSSFTEVG
jgi:glycosyltransferase involved in cell wall biosynthesis